MPNFPKIQRPCPLKEGLAEQMHGDLCGHCHQRVHDLSALSDAQREALYSTHTKRNSGLCVSYRLPASLALGASLIASSLSGPAANAEELSHSDATAIAPTDALNVGGDWIAEQAADAVRDCESIEVVITGGIDDLANAEFVKVDPHPLPPMLPVIYESNSETSGD